MGLVKNMTSHNIPTAIDQGNNTICMFLAASWIEKAQYKHGP